MVSFGLLCVQGVPYALNHQLFEGFFMKSLLQFLIVSCVVFTSGSAVCLAGPGNQPCDDLQVVLGGFGGFPMAGVEKGFCFGAISPYVGAETILAASEIYGGVNYYLLSTPNFALFAGPKLGGLVHLMGSYEYYGAIIGIMYERFSVTGGPVQYQSQTNWGRGEKEIGFVVTLGWHVME